MPSTQKEVQIHRLGRHSESPQKTAPPCRCKWDPLDWLKGKCALPTEEGSQQRRRFVLPRGCGVRISRALFFWLDGCWVLSHTVKLFNRSHQNYSPPSCGFSQQIHTWKRVRWALRMTGTKTKFFRGMVISFEGGKKKRWILAKWERGVGISGFTTWTKFPEFCQRTCSNT